MPRRSLVLVYGLPALAAGALLSAVLTLANTRQEVASLAPRIDPPLQPLAAVRDNGVARIDFIGAAGMVEPASEEIHVATAVSGTVERVFATPGARMEKDAPLFVLDTRIAEAVLTQRQRDLAAAEARLAQARARVPGLEAELEVALTAIQAALADRDEAADMVRIASGLEAGATISARELTRRKNALRTAQARLGEARARLARATADLALYKEAEGGMSIAVEKAAIEQARAAVALAERDLELRTVRAPISGTILRVNVRPGEYAEAGGMAPALLVMGAMDPPHVRVDIDEVDIPRWQPGAEAVASRRGDARELLRLKFVRREPLVVPKRSLSGAASERVDTRVMQVIYAIESDDRTVLAGQQLDVFIASTRTDLQARATP